MGTVILDFVAGTLGSLAIFLLSAYLSGERRFSAPFGVITRLLTIRWRDSEVATCSAFSSHTEPATVGVL